ncbi:MAG: D-alanyl-D-alanine endopeptidase [Porticoccaceae bacterium]|nr:D-alanyl-D-alanine endopeptidase [Porticoccaceae bacterium]
MMTKRLLISLLLTTSVTTASGVLAAPDTHTVSRGETLYGIASRHQISVEDILRHNSLRSATIHPGQVLSIPGAKSASNNTGSPNIYVVRRGDSLSSIAARHGTSVESLRQTNQLKSHMLHPGQELRVPGKSALRTQQAVSSRPAATHTIRRGDTLSAVAARNGVTVAALARHNGLSTRATLQIGQVLRIPSRSGVPSYRGTALASSSALSLHSNSVIIVDAQSGKTLYEKNADAVKPIASITKLMTAMVALDAKLPLTEELTVDRNDIDTLKKTSSRLPLGTRLTRQEMLRLALMSSENRAASALGRHYPGGSSAFIKAMNRKAEELGMTNTHFADTTGLDPRNVSTAADLVKLVAASSAYPLIREYSTTDGREITARPSNHRLQYINSNPLVRQGAWKIDVSKTGFINEAGRCLVMKAPVADRPAYMVFLQSSSRHAPMADANSFRKWIESGASGINVASL